MVTVRHAWDNLKARANSSSEPSNRPGSPASLFALMGVMEPETTKAMVRKPPDRKHVHTIQIGSGDNVQTIQWTEVESESDRDN